MPTLSRSDAERVLALVAETPPRTSGHPFTSEFLVELGRLVEADAIAYCELDRVRRTTPYYAERAPDEEPDFEVDPDVFWGIVIEEDPLCLAPQLGQFAVHKLSDFFSGRELHRQRFYDLWLRHYDTEYEIDLALPSPQWHTKTFIFARHRGSRDFTERDRVVLQTLQPHLAAMWHTASANRLLGEALAELESGEAGDSRGVVFLGSTGEIEFASPPARRLLRDFFGSSGRHLPAALAEWLEAGGSPYRTRKGHRDLTVVRSDGRLVLVERGVEPELTKREREILAWVARGKTNPEIAQLLWLAPSTVRKHLENVYAKLGVSTRTAAAARVFGSVDAGTS